MATIDVLKSNLANLENNLFIYEQEINSLTDRIKEVVTALNDDNVDLSTPVWDKMLAYSSIDFSTLEKKLRFITKVDSGDEIVDYSVTQKDLTLQKTIYVNGKEVNIYTSNKTDAIYVIADFNFNNYKDRKQLIGSLKDKLGDDQMAILTYGNNLYHYDMTNSKICSQNYDVVGKTDEGKMYAFKWKKNSSQIVVDDGNKNNRNLITSINGMVIANRMDIEMEPDTEINIKVRPKRNIGGGQTVEEYRRLAFTQGSSVRVTMDGEWVNYSNTLENRQNGTYISDWSGGGQGNPNHRVISVGDGPSEDYAYTRETVGHVDSDVIPITLKSTSNCQSQQIDATVSYNFSGNRRKGDTSHSKDFLRFYQQTVKDWYKI